MSTDMQTPTRAGSQSERRSAVEEDVAVLAAGKDSWARLPVASKIEHLRTLATNTAAQADSWVRAACGAKGLETQVASWRERSGHRGRGHCCSASTG